MHIEPDPPPLPGRIETNDGSCGLNVMCHSPRERTHVATCIGRRSTKYMHKITYNKKDKPLNFIVN